MNRLLLNPSFAGMLDAAKPQVTGRVVRVVGLTFEIEGLPAAIGDMVRLGHDPGVLGEIVALGERGPIGMPLGELTGIQIGTPARIDTAAPGVPVGWELLGRVLDGMGEPIDDGASLDALPHVDVTGTPPHPLRRALVREPQHLGVVTSVPAVSERVRDKLPAAARRTHDHFVDVIDLRDEPRSGTTGRDTSPAERATAAQRDAPRR